MNKPHVAKICMMSFTDTFTVMDCQTQASILQLTNTWPIILLGGPGAKMRYWPLLTPSSSPSLCKVCKFPMLE